MLKFIYCLGKTTLNVNSKTDFENRKIMHVISPVTKKTHMPKLFNNRFGLKILKHLKCEFNKYCMCLQQLI